MKKHILITLLLSSITFLFAIDYKFYNGTLKVVVPNNFELNQDDEIKQISSKNGETAISFVMYKKLDGNIKDFSEYRYQSIDFSTWNNKFDEINLKKQNYEIVGRKFFSKNKDLKYLVFCIAKNFYFLSFTFVTPTKNGLEDILVEDIVKKIEIK